MTRTPDEVVLEASDSAWLLAAVARRLHALSEPERPGTDVDEVALEVLEAAGLHLEVSPPEAAMRARGLRSQLAQLLALSDASAAPQWGDLDDGTLLAQGRASGTMAQLLFAPGGAAPAGMTERLGAPGAAFLDVGVGVGAICIALCRLVPGLRCVGIDVLPRALELAAQEAAAAGVGDRVELRLQDVQDLDDVAVFDVGWVPLPLLPEAVARAALPRVARAVKPGGWLLVAANRPHADPYRAALARLRAATVGGNAGTLDDARTWLAEAGAAEVVDIPTPPVAPALLGARLPG